MPDLQQLYSERKRTCIFLILSYNPSLFNSLFVFDSNSNYICINGFLQKCGKIDEQIEMLKRKLRLIYQGEVFRGKPTKTARSHGKKFQVSVKQETSRLLVRQLLIGLASTSYPQIKTKFHALLEPHSHFLWDKL